MISQKKSKYPFIIANTDSSDEGGMNWWSILDIEPWTYLLFLFVWCEWFKKCCFIIQDNKRVIKKILFGTEQLTRTDNKIMLVNVKFSLNACKNNLTKNELDNLSDTACDFF